MCTDPGQPAASVTSRDHAPRAAGKSQEGATEGAAVPAAGLPGTTREPARGAPAAADQEPGQRRDEEDGAPEPRGVGDEGYGIRRRMRIRRQVKLPQLGAIESRHRAKVGGAGTLLRYGVPVLALGGYLPRRVLSSTT